MGVTDRARERIRGIRPRAACELQQPADHFLYLLFFCVTIPHHRLLDLERGIFGHHKVVQHSRANRRPARLSEHQCRFRVDIDKHLFHSDLFRPMRHDDLIEVIHNGFETQRQFFFQRADTAAADVHQPATGFVDDPKAGDAQAWIDAENTDLLTSRRLGCLGLPDKKAYVSSITAVV